MEFPLYFLKSIDYEIINHRIDYEREREREYYGGRGIEEALYCLIQKIGSFPDLA